MKKTNTLLIASGFLLLFYSIFAGTGCVTKKVTVGPFERQYLEDYIMDGGRDKLAVKMYDHGYFSREASRGGKVVGGGGCGCN